ncbi:MAG: MBL fold metallo-hydrolase, partial [Candidatus Hadarchaeales archaeon]
MVWVEEPKTIELSPGVYAYLQPKGEWFVNNTGFLVGKREVVVIDSVASVKRAERFLAEIRRITDLPIKYLINTHAHPDHLWTNHLFHPSLTICHSKCREETLREREVDPSLYLALFPELEVEGVKVCPQDLTFEQSLTLYQETEEGEREIRMIHPGPAHTRGDLFLHLPEEGVVFCGDLLFSPPCTPFVLMGSVRGSIKTLELLRNLQARVYVPGHGPLSWGGKALEEAREYLEMIWREAERGLKEGKSVEEVIRGLELGKYASWRERERLLGNLERAYRELRGEPHMEREEVLQIMVRMWELR